jgi:uncharacterized membrane protein
VGILWHDNQYILDYISGELARRAKQLVISESEYQLLVNGETDVEGPAVQNTTPFNPKEI